MISIRKSEERGHANHGWLDTHFTFSFAEYHDPEFIHFDALRVINQDVIAPAKGFGTHGHENMEIVTYVLDGVLEHKDSMGSGSQIRPGMVQIMSAGTGVTHSEFNGSETEPCHLLQMWVFPRTKNTEPRYAEKPFPEDERRGRLRLVVAPDDADGALVIDQDARLYVSLLASGDSLEHEIAPGRSAWLHVGKGSVTLNGKELRPGDGAAIRDETHLSIEGVEDADLVMWELG